MYYPCTRLWSHIKYDQPTGSFSFCGKVKKYNLTEADLLLGDKLFTEYPPLIEARNELLAGGKPKNCDYCWGLEARNAPSYRMPGQVEIGKPPPVITVDVGFDITCDSKCIYCTELESSRWKAENKKYGQYFPIKILSDIKTKDDSHFWKWFDTNADTVEYLNFFGGETLLTKDFYSYFERILQRVQSVNQTIRISVYSNMNTPKSKMDRFIDVVNKINSKHNLRVCVSGEGSSDKFEYVRYGTYWDIFIMNIQRILRETSIGVCFVPTMNLISMSSFPEYVELCATLNEERPVVMEIVNQLAMKNPLSISGAPREMAVHVERSLHALQQATFHIKGINYVEGILSAVKSNPSMYSSDAEKYLIGFYSTVAEIDRRRKLNFSDTFPEFAELFSLGKSLAEKARTD